MTELTPQQQEAIEKIAEWYDSGGLPQPFRLFGAAGTGKTTLAREVPSALGLDLFGDSGVQYGAYTGKAASVLRGKGCTPANTLHSLVYVPMANMETQAKLRKAQEDLAAAREMGDAHADLQAELELEIQLLEKEAHTIGWEWNESSVLAETPLLILDEVSMVDAKLAADIDRFEIPVLVLGDPEQLEPVGGEGYYTDAAPDFALTEIHRQALDSPVLELATRVRLSRTADLNLLPDDFEPRSLSRAMEHDQVICWMNKTRWSLIEKMRAKLGRPKGQVVAGDRIMCLTNNRSLGVFNGQQFDVLGVQPGPLGPAMMLRDDNGVERLILGHADGFQGRVQQDTAKRMNLGQRGNRGLFTFANAITAHKAQGSEWGSVYVVDETPGLISMTAQRKGSAAGIAAGRRWMYTAVTRASDLVTIAGQP